MSPPRIHWSDSLDNIDVLKGDVILASDEHC